MRCSRACRPSNPLRAPVLVRAAVRGGRTARAVAREGASGRSSLRSRGRRAAGARDPQPRRNVGIPRDPEHPIFYAQALLEHWQRRGAKVLNGAQVLAIDLSKARQLSLISSLGHAVPRTRVVHRAADLVAASQDIGFPLLVKANIGGSGRESRVTAAARGLNNRSPTGRCRSRSTMCCSSRMTCRCAAEPSSGSRRWAASIFTRSRWRAAATASTCARPMPVSRATGPLRSFDESRHAFARDRQRRRGNCSRRRARRRRGSS